MKSKRQSFENYFNNDYCDGLMTLCDGKLRTEDGGTFPIHKVILAKNNDYFYALFCGMVSAKAENAIPGVAAEVLRNILSYIYTGHTDITEENLFDLIVASDYLLQDDLLLQLKMALRTNLSAINSLPIYIFSFSNDRFEILSETFRFIQTNFESLVYNQDCNISDLSLGALNHLLSDRNLYVRSERTVWFAILKWVNAEDDTDSCLVCVPELLFNLAVPDLEEDTAREILQHDIVAQNPYCQEILQCKSFFPDGNDLEALKLYLQTNIKSELTCNNPRQPKSLSYIVHSEDDVIKVYLTYDESIDLWRKILERDLTEILFIDVLIMPVNERIYTFSENKRYYDVIEKQWNNVADFIIARSGYCVVELNRFIYILGGTSVETGDDIYDVEAYDCIEGMWHVTEPMEPVSSFLAVTHNDCIYVVGLEVSVIESDMMAQVFDPSIEIWEILPPPSVYRWSFALIVYHEKAYVLGGYNNIEYEWLKDVEVFDISEQKWDREEDLPYAYQNPASAVLNDKLIVYEKEQEFDDETSPPVQWNLLKKKWEIYSASSSMNNLQFFTVNDSDFIRVITKENRSSEAIFERSNLR